MFSVEQVSEVVKNWHFIWTFLWHLQVGVTAAAVSMLVFSLGNGDDLVINRPFDYFIRDDENKIILFLGRFVSSY